MSRVSKRKLDKKVEEEIFHLFWESVSKLHNASEVSSFFSDFLSDTEEMMLAKRFAVAILLLRGKRPVDITSSLHVTYTTVGTVASWLKNAKSKTQNSLKRIIKIQNWQSVIDRLEGLLDQLPPDYGSNWQAAGQAKWERTKDRSARQSIR